MTGSLGFSFKAEFNNSDVLAKLRQLKQEFIGLRDDIKNTVSDLKIKVTTDTTDVAQDIKDIKQMFSTVDEQKIKVTADTSSIQKEIKETTDNLDKLEKKAAETGKKSGENLNPLADGLRSIKANIVGLIASYISFGTLNTLKEMSDDAALLNARFTQLLDTQAEVEQTQARLYESAQRLGVGYQDMSDSAARMLPAMQQQKKGAEEAIKLAEILQVTAKLSGATAAEAASVATQFGQSLNSQLQAEELNSILDGNQTLARTLADALKLPESSIDVTVGMLKKLASEGRITSEVLADSLLGSYDKIMAKADQMPQTFSKVWQQIKNLTFKFVEDLNKQGFFSDAIDGFNDLHLKIKELEQNGTLKAWANGVAGVLGAAGAAMSDLVGIATDTFNEISSLWSDLTDSIEDGTGVQITLFDLLKAAVNGVGLVFVLLRTGIQAAFGLIKYVVRETVLDVIERFNEFQTKLETLKTNAAFFLDVLGANFRTFAQVASNALAFNWEGVKASWSKGFSDLEKLAQDRTKRIAQINLEAQGKQQAIDAGRTDNQNALNKGLGGVVDGVSNWLGRIINPTKPQEAPPKVNAPSRIIAPKVNVGAGKDDDGKAAKKAAEEAAREAEALARAKYENEKALIEIQMQQNEDKYKAEETQQETYFANREKYIKQISALEQAELSRRVAAEKQGSAKQQDETARQKAIADEASKLSAIKLERKKADEQRKKDEEQLQIDLARAEGRSLYTRMHEIKFKYDEAYRDIERRFSGTLDFMQEAAKQRQIAIIIKIKQLEEDNASADDIEKRSQKIITLQRDQEASLERARTRSGGWNDLTINKAINQTRQDAIKNLEQQLTELTPLANSGIDGIDEKIRSLKTSIEELSETIPTAFDGLALSLKQTSRVALESGISDFFMDLLEGSKSAGEAFKDFARNFIKSIAQVLVQIAAAYAALLILNAIPGGPAIAKMMDIGATVVNVGTTAAKTKQLHDGGIVGTDGKDRRIDRNTKLAPNEMHAILEKGEEVLTADDPRHRRNFDPAAHMLAIMPKYHIGGIAGLEPGTDGMPDILKGAERNRGANGGNNAAKGPATIVKVISVYTREMAMEHLASSEGETTLLNMVERNASAIKTILEDR